MCYIIWWRREICYFCGYVRWGTVLVSIWPLTIYCTEYTIIITIYIVTQNRVELNSGPGYNHYSAIHRSGYLRERTKQKCIVERKWGYLAREWKLFDIKGYWSSFVLEEVWQHRPSSRIILLLLRELKGLCCSARRNELASNLEVILYEVGSRNSKTNLMGLSRTHLTKCKT